MTSYNDHENDLRRKVEEQATFDKAIEVALNKEGVRAIGLEKENNYLFDKGKGSSYGGTKVQHTAFSSGTYLNLSSRTCKVGKKNKKKVVFKKLSLLVGPSKKSKYRPNKKIGSICGLSDVGRVPSITPSPSFFGLDLPILYTT